MHLSDLALRLLGSLIEKQMATPQSYPLSVNALRSAANQSTNREPVTNYDEVNISEGLKELSGQSLVRAAYAKRSSTPKYEHLLDEHLEIGGDQIAVLSVLMLRGPQTVGEIRQRTDRLHSFDDIGEVAATLDSLVAHPFGVLVTEMARLPGQKETRWVHLLGREEVSDQSAVVATAAPVITGPSEVELIRREVAALQQQVKDLADQLVRLKRFVGA